MSDQDKEELEFLRWFYAASDFGPADGDVKDIMKEQYTKQTGNPVPERYK